MGQAESHFSFYKVSSDTFTFTQDSDWGVMPFVYAKIYDDAIVVIDTGSFGSTRGENEDDFHTLRSLLETQPVPDNNDVPLNEGGTKKYVVLSTHCHEDHIVRQGFQFADPDRPVQVWASSYDKGFVHMEGEPHPAGSCRLSQDPHEPEGHKGQDDTVLIPARTPEELSVDSEGQIYLGKGRGSSQLDNLGDRTSYYQVTDWADDGEGITTTIKDNQQAIDLGLTVFHAPGMLPDQVFVWDPTQRILFSGDFLYELLYMNFQQDASFQTYCDSLAKIQTLVQGWNAESPSAQKRVKLAGAHGRIDADAEEMLSSFEALLLDVMEGRIEGHDRGTECGGETIAYDSERFFLCGRRKLFDEFRADEEAMEKLRNRRPRERADSLARHLGFETEGLVEENVPTSEEARK